MSVELTSLDRLHSKCLAETPCALVYDDLTRLVATTLGVQVAVVSILGTERYWYRSRSVHRMAETSAAIRICDIFLRTMMDTVVVKDALAHPTFHRHPCVLGPPYMRCFLGARLKNFGRTVGTLCAFDAACGKFSETQFEDMRILAEAVLLEVETNHPLDGE